MPTTDELKQRIEQALPGATCSRGPHRRRRPLPRRGGSERFEGLRRIEQHKLIYDVFGNEIGGPIHALSIKTSTPGGPNDDQRRDSRVPRAGDRRERGDALHEGHARPAALRLLGAHVGALNALGVSYAAMDILPDPRIREQLSALSGWPTIPQLFVNGKLVGGCRHRHGDVRVRRAGETCSEWSSPRSSRSRSPPSRECRSRRRSASRTGWAKAPARASRRA